MIDLVVLVFEIAWDEQTFPIWLNNAKLLPIFKLKSLNLSRYSTTRSGSFWKISRIIPICYISGIPRSVICGKKFKIYFLISFCMSSEFKHRLGGKNLAHFWNTVSLEISVETFSNIKIYFVKFIPSTQIECVGVAKGGNIKKAPSLTLATRDFLYRRLISDKKLS